MAIDYNDPVVAEEFAKVQPMSFEDVEEELQADVDLELLCLT